MKDAIRAAAIGLGVVLLAAPEARAEDHVIVQKGKTFSAAEIVLKAGDRIVFRNEDEVSHNVFSRSPGEEFEVRVQLPGQETAVALTKAGSADVRCAIHPQMKLHVTVEPKP